jgi:GNAT superfamily N-acetyltransferase
MRGCFAFDVPAGDPFVRTATEADVESIARVSVDTWRLTYGGILPAPYLARMRLEPHEAQRRRLIRASGSIHVVAVEPQTTEVVGFCSAGQARGGGVAADASAEIYELYIQNGFQGRGVGRRLFRAAQAWLAGQGHRSLVVWVLSRNPNRGFYERLGGQSDGVQMIRVGGASVEETSYVWRDLKRSNARSA